MTSEWGRLMQFPHGVVEEIRMDRDLIEVTTFGSSRQEFVSGLTHVTMRLRLEGPGAVDAVLAALGASDRQRVEARETLAVLAARGRRDLDLR